MTLAATTILIIALESIVGLRTAEAADIHNGLTDFSITSWSAKDGLNRTGIVGGPIR